MLESRSILHPCIGGLVYVTGLHGLGKTTFATEAENPALTGVLDLDLKFEAMAKKMGYAWYRGPYSVPKEPFGYNIAALAAWFSEIVIDIPPGLTTLVIDNATEIESALGSIVLKDPSRYGVNPANAQAGRYGGVNPGIGKLWQSILSYLKSEKGIHLVVVVSHMSQPWIDGKPLPNRYRGKGNRVLQQYSNLSIVMVAGDTPPIPSAVVLKEALSQRTFDPETGEFSNTRTVPLRLPQATWKAIREYMDNPASFTKPQPGEVPSRQELTTYGDFMSKEHLEFIKTVVTASWEEDGETVEDSPQSASVVSAASPSDKCPVCYATAASPSSDRGHAPWCKAGENGARYDNRKK